MLRQTIKSIFRCCNKAMWSSTVHTSGVDLTSNGPVPFYRTVQSRHLGVHKHENVELLYIEFGRGHFGLLWLTLWIAGVWDLSSFALLSTQDSGTGPATRDCSQDPPTVSTLENVLWKKGSSCFPGDYSQCSQYPMGVSGAANWISPEFCWRS